MPASQTCSANRLFAFHLKWFSKGIKYSRIKLNPDIGEIITTNMETLLNKMKVNLDNWSKLRLTLWGKGNTIKMVIVPQINYIAGMIPIYIPQQLLPRYNNMIKDILGDGRKPRIHMDELSQRKEEAYRYIKYYSIYFEKANLARHWDGANSEMDWILTEQ